MTRLSGAITAVRQGIATAAEIAFDSVGPDEDIVDELNLDELERESLGLILEELFCITIPDGLWKTPLYRTAASLAEWCIRQSALAAEIELQRQRRFG